MSEEDGHEIDPEIVWDPPLPEFDRSDRQDLWLAPRQQLGFEALKLLRNTFELPCENLVALKNRLSDGRHHLLMDCLAPDSVPRFTDLLDEVGVSYEIRPNGGDLLPRMPRTSPE